MLANTSQASAHHILGFADAEACFRLKITQPLLGAYLCLWKNVCRAADNLHKEEQKHSSTFLCSLQNILDIFCPALCSLAAFTYYFMRIIMVDQDSLDHINSVLQWHSESFCGYGDRYHTETMLRPVVACCSSVVCVMTDSSWLLSHLIPSAMTLH